MIKGTAITAAVSGTISEITGGKFANGAVTGAFIHLFNNMAEQFVDYRDPNKVAFGNGSPVLRALGRGYDNVAKAISGGINGVNKLIFLKRPNDPMFQMLRYKAIGKSSEIKLLEIQPDISDLNFTKEN